MDRTVDISILPSIGQWSINKLVIFDATYAVFLYSCTTALMETIVRNISNTLMS